MKTKRTLIVGDIHGCYEEFMQLLKKASYDEKTDRLILVGDLINKGPSSLKTLEWVANEGCEVVLGNHELGFLNYIENPNPKFEVFRKLVSEMGDSLEEWVQWFKKIPLYIEEDFIVVHAGIVPGYKLEETPAHLLTRIRTWDGHGEDLNSKMNPAWHELYEGEKVVIYGHWAGQGLRVEDKTIGLDSGCCWGGKLSLLHLETRDVFQVDAKETYAKE